MRGLLPVVVVLTLVVAACDGDEVSLTTTSTLLTGTTEPPETTTTTEPEADTTTTTLRGETVSNYEVVARLSGDDGETLLIVIPPGAYTDVDLENFVGDLKESDPDLWGAEIFDDPQAPDVFGIPEVDRTEDQQQILEEHHFASLERGDTIVFRGPFAEFGQQVIGS